ncbi:hypothetical protein [Streptomyces sp. NPDC058206]|uniref:hypothetical protein n=1 Tax=Streptomyces sp. NPDC058206 TaxID=3346382 RepID=UPI0036E24405
MRHPSSRGRRAVRVRLPRSRRTWWRTPFRCLGVRGSRAAVRGRRRVPFVADRDLDGGISGQQPGAFGGPHGLHQTEYPDNARRAVIAMCNAIAQWYRPGGPVTEDELVERYVSLALTVVEYRPRAARRPVRA